MTKNIISVANQKGGVGKTTTAVNLACALGLAGENTLLIDLDPQGNATMGCGINKLELETVIGDVLINGVALKDAIRPANNESIFVAPSNQQTTVAEVQMLSMEEREFQLKKAIETIYADYDYIVIDCPPTLNMLTVNALAASQSVLIPMQCEYYALEGLSSLTQTIQRIKETSNPSLEIYGILRTMYDPRNNLALEVSGQLSEYFGDRLFTTIVPRNVRLAEAPSFGRSIMSHDLGSKGAQAYLALAGEVLRRDQSTRGANV